MENSREVPQKIKNRTTICSSNHTSRCISKGNKSLSQRNLCTLICCNITHSSKDTKTTYVPNDRWMGTENTVLYECIISYIICDIYMLMLSCVWLSVTPQTIAHQAPLSMEFSRQEYWSGLVAITYSRESSQPRVLNLVIFPTQGSKSRHLHLLHWQKVLYHCATWKAQHTQTHTHTHIWKAPQPYTNMLFGLKKTGNPDTCNNMDQSEGQHAKWNKPDTGKHSVISVQSLSHVRLFATPWIAARQASLSITNSWSPLKLMSIESVMPSNHLILCRSLLFPPSIFPSIRVFSNESALHIRWPKY